MERAAFGASLLCLIHCLALPLLVALLPALSSMLPSHTSFHLWMLAFAIPVSGIGLLIARSEHGRTMPLLVGFAGLILLALGGLAFGETAFEIPFTVIGAAMLAAAHIASMHFRHRHHSGKADSAREA